MADSDIVVSGLATAAGISYNALSYTTVDPHEDGLLNQALDVVEVWAALANNRSVATKVAEGNKTNALHVALGNAETWFYWIRARNKQGYYGEWHPSGATSGVQGRTAFIGPTEGGLPTDWTSYTPTISSDTGTLTSVTSISGRFATTANAAFVNVQFVITTNGTGATGLRFTLPTEAPAEHSGVPLAVGSGRRTSDAAMLRAIITDEATARVRVFLYDGTYPGVSGAQYDVTIVYPMLSGWSQFDSFTVTAGSGTFTSITGKRGKFKSLGSITIFNFEFTIATNGTAATSIVVELPIPAPVIQSQVGAVQISGGARASGHATIVTSGLSETTLTIRGYDGVYPGQDGAVVRGTIIYTNTPTF